MSATAAHQDSDADSLRNFVAIATGVDVSNVKNLVIVTTTNRRRLNSGRNPEAFSVRTPSLSLERSEQTTRRLTTYTWDASFSVASDSSVTSADSLATSVNQALSDASFISTVTNGISSATSLSVTAVVALTRNPTPSPIPVPTRQPSPAPSLSLNEPPLPTASDSEATSVAFFGIIGAGGALALCLICSGLFQVWKCVRKRPANSGDDNNTKKKRSSKEEKKAIEAERKAKLAPRGTYRATALFREAEEVDAKDANKKGGKNKKELKPQMSLADYTNFKPLEDISKKRDSSSSSSSSDDDDTSEEEDVLSALENTGSRAKQKRFGRKNRSESKDSDGYGSDDSDGNSSMSSKASSVRSDVSSLSALAKKHSSFAQNNKKGGQQSFLLSRQSSTQSSVGGPRTSDPDCDDSGSLFGADDLDEMVGRIADSTGISRGSSFNYNSTNAGGIGRGSSFNNNNAGGARRGSSFNTAASSRFSRSSSSMSDLAGDDDDGPKITAAQIRAARMSQSTLAPVPESESGQESGSTPSSSAPPPAGFVRHEVAQSALNELVDLRKQLGAKSSTNGASAGASTGAAAGATSSAGGPSNLTPRHPETPLEYAWDKVLTVAERDLNLWGRNMEVLFMSLDWEGNTLIDVAELCGSLAQHGVAPFTPEEQEAFRVDINPRFHAGTITCTEFGTSVKKRFEFEKSAVSRKAEHAKLADAKKAEESKENAKRDSIKDKAVQRRQDKEAALAKLKEEAAAEEAAEQAALEAATAKLNASKTTTQIEDKEDSDQKKEGEQEEEQPSAAVAAESEPQSPESEKEKKPEEQEEDEENEEKKEEEKQGGKKEEEGGDDEGRKKGPAKRRASTAALEALKSPVVEEYHAGQENLGLSLEVGVCVGAFR